MIFWFLCAITFIIENYVQGVLGTLLCCYKTFFFKVIDELRFRIFENCTSKEIDHNFYYILPNRTKPGTARTVLIETALAGDSLYL